MRTVFYWLVEMSCRDHVWVGMFDPNNRYPFSLMYLMRWFSVKGRERECEDSVICDVIEHLDRKMYLLNLDTER